LDFQIAVLAGDGIGPEVTAQGANVLETVGRVFGHNFRLEYGDVGGISIDNHGTPLLPEVSDLAASADAVLFGAGWAVPNGTTPAPRYARKTAFWSSAPASVCSLTSVRLKSTHGCWTPAH